MTGVGESNGHRSPLRSSGWGEVYCGVGRALHEQANALGFVVRLN